MKILLVEPGTEFDINVPSGLLKIAAVLREHKIDVVLKNYSGLKITKEKIIKDLEKIDFDIIGIKVLTSPIIGRAILISKAAKELKKTVVWGGPHPTVMPNQTLENKFIDSIVIGEGEKSFLDLIKYYRNGGITPLGCAIKKNKKIIVLPPQKECVDINKLPLTAWDLIEDINRYFPNKKHNTVSITTSRGCMYNCGFCHNSNKNVNNYQGNFRLLDTNKMIEEFNFVNSLTKNEIDRVYFNSDLHLAYPEYIKKFSKDLIKSKLNIKWNSSSRFHILNEELINIIDKAGCEEVLFGTESGSKRIQKLVNKPINKEHAIKISKILRKKGIYITNAYIFGHPTETFNELKQTIKLISEIPADQNLVQLYRPLPGTPYFELCKKVVNGFDKIIPKKLEDWNTFGVAGYDINVSKIPSRKLYYNFYRWNLIYQLSHHINLQKFHLRNKRYEDFFKTFYNNKFTFKAKEMLTAKKYIK
ncbi:MAG: B12-binding domain-containing radical SAM protein [Nanoarchaeota archaeon]|nr:B12-binding domain-containing radical SAM protein [Nanoarchaeota archaeon]